MKINVAKKVGKSNLTFQVEDEKVMDSLFLAAFFAQTPDQCGLCKSQDVELDANRAKGFLFAKIKCTQCNGRSQVGQLKEGGFFWKDWEKYERPVEKDE